MAEMHDFNPTDASNTARWPENMAPSAVNNAARADEGLIARWYFDNNYSVVSTLSGSVIQMTANRISLTLTGTTSNYIANMTMAFTSGSTLVPGPCSVNINGIGPISLRDNSGGSLSSSAIPSGTQCFIMKDGTNDYFRLLSPARSFPLQSAFLATRATTLTNVTGDGTNYTVVFETEVFDRNSDFAALTTFTASVTGLHRFSTSLTMAEIGAAHTDAEMQIVTSNRTYRHIINPYAIRSSGNFASMGGSVLADMDAGDTCVIKIAVSGGTLTVDLGVASSGNYNYFSGELV